jgi:DNA-binding SARP family transcriptional activator
MALLHISLFGKFHVRKGQQTLTGLDAPKVQELFCYLLLYRERPHPREALAALLWDDRHTDQPNRCLRKTLWQLRSTLDAQAESLSDRVLLVEPIWVQLNPRANLWLDVAVFEQAFRCVESLQGSELDAQNIQSLQSAVNLYRGGLQESWYQDWYLYERERFQHMYLATLDKLMEYCETHRNYETGLAYGTLILSCERARERTHRRLMRLYHLIGDRTAALRQYEHCINALHEELGVKPAKRTETLYQQIRTDQFGELTLRPARTAKISQAAISPLPTVLGRLRQLHTVLTELQREIHQDIQAVELALTIQDRPTPPR